MRKNKTNESKNKCGESLNSHLSPLISYWFSLTYKGYLKYYFKCFLKIIKLKKQQKAKDYEAKGGPF